MLRGLSFYKPRYPIHNNAADTTFTPPSPHRLSVHTLPLAIHSLAELVIPELRIETSSTNVPSYRACISSAWTASRTTEEWPIIASEDRSQRLVFIRSRANRCPHLQVLLCPSLLGRGPGFAFASCPRPLSSGDCPDIVTFHARFAHLHLSDALRLLSTPYCA